MAVNSLRAHSCTTRLPPPESRRRKPLLLSQNSLRLHPHLFQTPWLGAKTKLFLNSSNRIGPFIPTRQPIRASVLFSLPTANPERGVVAGGEIPKWSSKAIKSFAMGELEARKLKYPTTGTEALLMGILIEGTNFASKFMRNNGITLTKVREETIKLLGKADMYYFSPEHPPLTEDAQKALDWAVDHKLKSGHDGEITTVHLLLGVWSQEASPGHKILAAFGFNKAKAEELHSVISEPGFLDN